MGGNNDAYRQQESSSRGIMYHSRMRYLASREGSRRSTSLRERGSGIVGESSLPSRPSMARSSSHIPCSPERLVPPVQLMTRERSFRYTYWKYHKLPTISFQNTDFLKKKEDPVVKKKRDEIFARIRAAELTSERLKREKELWKRNETMQQNADPIMTNKTDDNNPMKTLNLEYSDRNVTDDTNTTTTNDYKNDDIKSSSIYSSSSNNRINNDHPAFQLSEGNNSNKSDNHINRQPFSTPLFKSPDSSSNEESNISGEDVYPEKFSFISEWTKDRSYKWSEL